MGKEIVRHVTHSAKSMYNMAMSVSTTPSFYQSFCDNIQHVDDSVIEIDGEVWPFTDVCECDEGLCLMTSESKKDNIFIVLGINMKSMVIYARFYGNINNVKYSLPIEYTRHFMKLVDELAFPHAEQISKRALALSVNDYQKYCHRIIEPGGSCVPLTFISIHSDLPYNIDGSSLSVANENGCVYLVNTLGYKYPVIATIGNAFIIGTTESYRMSPANSARLARTLSEQLTVYNLATTNSVVY